MMTSRLARFQEMGFSEMRSRTATSSGGMSVTLASDSWLCWPLRNTGNSPCMFFSAHICCRGRSVSTLP